jgi:predicted ATP-grasp superfamily ATP-dependent carboligase
MDLLIQALKTHPIIYITRDIERAIGIDLDTSSYFIISNKTSFAKQIAQERENILLIETDKQLDTWELLQHEETKKFISEIKNPHILVFKNTEQIERICVDNKWTLLNSSAKLANRVEEKISQVEWLGELAQYLPPHKILLCKDVSFADNPFILQFNRAHTGTGTMLIENNSQLEEIQQKFPNREVRVTDYISGPMFTNNNVVTSDNILIGNINYQITGLAPFTGNKFSTIGNDWGVVKKLLNETQINEYHQIVTDIGNKLRTDGWKGLFGVDVILEEKTGKLYLIEINARQPASTTYESILQKQIDDKKLTTFEAHLASLLDLEISEDIIEIEDGAQIVLRNSEEKKIDIEKIESELKKQDFEIIRYDNTKAGSDLLRIQSTSSYMEKHAEFNNLGNHVAQAFRPDGQT